MAMKVMATPARVPSMAARGVRRRIVGPMKAPMMAMMPWTKHQATPTPHASSASLVER